MEKRDMDQYVQWLKCTDTASYYNEARKEHIDKTGNWFLHGEFRTWLNTPYSFFLASRKR